MNEDRAILIEETSNANERVREKKDVLESSFKEIARGGIQEDVGCRIQGQKEIRLDIDYGWYWRSMKQKILPSPWPTKLEKI